MKSIFTFLLCCCVSGTCLAQLLNGGAYIIIESGATLTLEGAVSNENAGTVNNSGTMIVEGDLVNTGTFNTSFTNSVLAFSGSTPSSFTPGGMSLTTLENRKTGADLNLAGNLIVTNSINLTPATNSKINIGDADLMLGLNTTVITGASANKYISTNGTGYLIKNVTQSGVFTFPVGNTGGLTGLTANFTGVSFANASLKVKVNPSVADDLPAGITDFIDRHWEVIAENITDYRNEVTANYLRNDIEGLEDPINGASYANGMWSYEDAGRTNGTLIGTIQVPNALFAGFNTLALPVELSSFTAEKESEKTVRLAWSTSSEQNTDYFDVERSTDARDWSVVGQVAAAGESQTMLDYRFLDQDIPLAARRAGTVYYRLNMVDFDGSQAYSPIELVGFTPVDGAISAYPNPTADILQIDTREEIISLTVYDGLGKRLLYTAAQEVSLKDFPAGIYRIMVTTASGTQVLTVARR